MGPVVRPRSRPAGSIFADEQTPGSDNFLSKDSVIDPTFPMALDV